MVFKCSPLYLHLAYISFANNAGTLQLNARCYTYSWYKELVLAGARFHYFPIEYITTIESNESK